MDLCKEIMLKVLEDANITVHGAEEIMQSRCYNALKEIANIVRSCQYDDIQCFRAIEEIIVALEDLGIFTGSRHDFG